MVQRILRATGKYDVIGATDGKHGLELVAEHKPALVLVDLDVPSVNGFEVTRRIKRSADPAIAAIPIVAVSANVLKNEGAQALAAGATAFIEKPFDIREFRDHIDRLVTRGGE